MERRGIQTTVNDSNTGIHPLSFLPLATAPSSSQDTCGSMRRKEYKRKGKKRIEMEEREGRGQDRRDYRKEDEDREGKS